MKEKSNKSVKIEFTTNKESKGEVHYVGVINDYTLCGATMDMDSSTMGDFKGTTKKVNCENCIRIVKFCKSLKP